MQNILLVIHLILALCLIGVVLLQRSEGGGLGIGGGGGGVSGRAAPTAMSKLTWVFAVGFLATSISLTILAASSTSSTSVIDRLGTETGADGAALPPALEGGLLPPTLEDAPAAPPIASE